MSMDVTTKSIKSKDIPRLHSMFRSALHEDFAYFPGEYIEKVSRDNNYKTFVRARMNSKRVMMGLFEANRLIGYAIADITIPTDSDIFWFYIIPEKRGNGLGKMFFNELLSELKRLGTTHVYLLTHNQKGFYEAFDFDLLNENKDLFKGITMYEMAKDL